MDPKEAALYAQFLIDKKGASEQEAHGFVKQKFGVDLSPSIGQMAKDAGMATLRGVGSALDYAGGNVRNAVAQGADAALGTELTQEGDTMRALKGDAPSSSEYLGRGGMEEGWKRTGAGLALDIASDPLTYATLGIAPALKGASTVAKLGRMEKLAEGLKVLSGARNVGSLDKILAAAQNPLEILTPKAGTAVYKSAFTPVETKIEQEMLGKKTPISEILMNEGFVGNSSQALEKVRKLNKEAGAQIGDAVSAAEGKVLTPTDEIFSKSQQKIDELALSKDPETRAMAEKLQENLDATMSNMGNVVDPKEALSLKRQIDSKLNSKAWKISESGTAKDQIYKQMAMDIKDNAIQMPLSNLPEQDLYNSVLKANKEFAATDKTVQKALLQQAKNESRRKAISVIDTGLAAGAIASPQYMLPILAGKKAGQALGSTRGKTTIGSAMRSEPMQLINKYMTDPASRRVIMNLMKEDEK